MTQLTIGDKEICLVDVVEGSSCYVDNVFGWLRSRVYVNFIEVPHTNEIKLPPGSWLLLGKASEITEEQAKGIVPLRQEWEDMEGYPIYVMDDSLLKWRKHIVFDTALESLYSLLTSQGFKKENTIILIKE